MPRMGQEGPLSWDTALGDLETNVLVAGIETAVFVRVVYARAMVLDL